MEDKNLEYKNFQKPQDKKKTKKRKGCIFSILISFLVLIILAAAAVGLIAIYYISTVPKLEDLTPNPIAETSKVFAIDGSLLTEFHADENREIIPFSKMSENIRNAVVSVEDKRFYDHQGVDYKRIAGAFIADVRARDFAQGASTITQQYVKNIYFNPEKTIRRKVNEAIIAIQLERNYTKDKILEMYLNTAYFGAGAYGVEKAAQTYFAVPAGSLSISQSALLAGLLRAPEIYSPFNDIQRSIQRRNTVLTLMKDQGLIDNEEYMDALVEPVNLNTSESSFSKEENRFAPFFIDYIKQQIYDKKFSDYDVFKGGLRIYTTLDKDLQVKAENAFKKVFSEPIEPSYSLVSVDSNTGYIYAMVGGKDYKTSKFNIATQGKRQPGSVFKVPVLIEAIIQHIPPETTFNPNGPITIEIPGSAPWIVDNYGGQKFGEQMNIVDATINSVNVVYAQLMMQIGADNVENLLKNMNIDDIGNNPAIALGGLDQGITPLDTSKIFTTLASGGLYREPLCILKITDSEDKVLYEYKTEKDSSEKRIIKEPEAFLVTQILQRAMNEGTGKNAVIGRPAAGKTGTTSDFKDAWFAGYTPELTTVVWMGYQESSKPMEPINNRSITGGSFPAEIWREFMSEALKGRPIVQFKTPDSGFLQVQVCKDSGLLPTFWCPTESLLMKMFLSQDAPTDYCNIHNKITVPDITGLNIEEARQVLQELFFTINETFEENNDFVQGIVMKSDPAPGTVVEAVDNISPVITLFVSQGSQTFIMPDLKGQTLASAQDTLSQSGLIISSTIYDYSLDQPANLIYSQNPTAGSEITAADAITVYISQGISPSGQVPEVKGLLKQDAVLSLNNAGFYNIVIIEETSEYIKNSVISQEPAAGSSYDKNLPVNLKISKGILVPDVVGKTKENAIKILESKGFVAEIIPENADGKVIAQNPEKETYASFGSKVALTFETPSTSSSTSSSSSTTETTGSTSETSSSSTIP